MTCTIMNYRTCVHMYVRVGGRITCLHSMHHDHRGGDSASSAASAARGVGAWVATPRSSAYTGFGLCKVAYTKSRFGRA
eukprot:COSAG02_NODE_3725_length_6318_cov_3.342660_1_plen_79_part_00